MIGRLVVPDVPPVAGRLALKGFGGWLSPPPCPVALQFEKYMYMYINYMMTIPRKYLNPFVEENQT